MIEGTVDCVLLLVTKIETIVSVCVDREADEDREGNAVRDADTVGVAAADSEVVAVKPSAAIKRIALLPVSASNMPHRTAEALQCHLAP